MTLPKIDVPLYDLTIPSTKKKVKVRPFTVKEEKLLLIAMESQNLEEIIATVKQVINNCVIKGEIDIDKIPFFDVDYIFIFLRAKSVGDTVSVKLTCNNVLEDETVCGNVFETDMDIGKIEVVQEIPVTNDIKLDKTKGVKMKYPNYVTMRRLETNDVDMKTEIIIKSIEHIYDKDGVYPARDYSKEELKEFVEGLTEANYKKLEAFVDYLPTFMVKLEATCPKCKFHHVVRYSDFYDFFI